VGSYANNNIICLGFIQSYSIAQIIPYLLYKYIYMISSKMHANNACSYRIYRSGSFHRL